MPRIRYQDVIGSSNIRGLAWENGVGYVEFMAGRRFAYTMPFDLFEKMRTATSVGSFFARNVKGKCPVVWNGHACANSPCKNDATQVGHPGNDARIGVFHVCDDCAATAPQLRAITFKPIPETKP